MVPSLDVSTLNLLVALSCGALIGSERQVRQRMAGLRTNALVALGAASFVTFAALYPTEVSPTRVAAQIVSGIGFLGAGIIFRDGFNVHGLNTAATLWCSAGVGMMAGAGAWLHALMLTAMVAFVNLGLRPVVKFLKRHTKAGVPIGRAFRVSVTCTSGQEADTRSLMLRTLALGGLHLSDIALTVVDGSGTILLSATVASDGLPDLVVEQAVQRLAAEPGLSRVAWEALDES